MPDAWWEVYWSTKGQQECPETRELHSEGTGAASGDDEVYIAMDLGAQYKRPVGNGPRTSMKEHFMKSVWAAAWLSSTMLLSTAEAASNNFFDNLSGKWSGAGKAYVTKYGEISAKCRVAINGTGAKLAMKGSCRMLVFRQALGLSIRNVGGNRYVGTYTGSKTGPAKLEGTLQGNQLVMTMKWGGLVNGDRTAQMVLIRTGPNSFAQIVNDRVEGKMRSTSHFTFVRS